MPPNRQGFNRAHRQALRFEPGNQHRFPLVSCRPAAGSTAAHSASRPQTTELPWSAKNTAGSPQEGSQMRTPGLRIAFRARPPRQEEAARHRSQMRPADGLEIVNVG